MRKLAFNVVAFLGGIGVTVLRGLGSGITTVVAVIFVNLIKLVGIVSGALLHLIDKERIAMYTAMSETFSELEDSYSDLERQNLELKLLSAVSDLKAHAEENDEGWTENHTEALNAVATSLVEELGCDEDEVFGYMRRIVESIPGLEFGLDDIVD